MFLNLGDLPRNLLQHGPGHDAVVVGEFQSTDMLPGRSVQRYQHIDHLADYPVHLLRRHPLEGFIQRFAREPTLQDVLVFEDVLVRVAHPYHVRNRNRCVSFDPTDNRGFVDGFDCWKMMP